MKVLIKRYMLRAQNAVYHLKNCEQDCPAVPSEVNEQQKYCRRRVSPRGLVLKFAHLPASLLESLL
jgi:hypothetical protein